MTSRATCTWMCQSPISPLHALLFKTVFPTSAVSVLRDVCSSTQEKPSLFVLARDRVYRKRTTIILRYSSSLAVLSWSASRAILEYCVTVNLPFQKLQVLASINYVDCDSLDVLLARRLYTAQLISELILSRLNYCNALLAGLPCSTIQHLQRVEYVAARLVCDLRPHDHVTPALKQLHWLPIKSRIVYKLCLSMPNIHTGRAPQYLVDCVSPMASSSSLPLCLRSSHTAKYVRHRTQTKLFFRGQSNYFVFRAKMAQTTQSSKNKLAPAPMKTQIRRKRHILIIFFVIKFDNCCCAMMMQCFRSNQKT